MLAGAEPFDRLQPLLLRAIGVQRRGADVLGLQLARDPIGANLRAHEHQHRAGRVAPHEVREPVDLLAARQLLDRVLDGPRRAAVGAHLQVASASAAPRARA